MIVEIVELEVRTGPGLMSSVLTSCYTVYHPPLLTGIRGSDKKVWKWPALVTNGAGDVISDLWLIILQLKRGYQSTERKLIEAFQNCRKHVVVGNQSGVSGH